MKILKILKVLTHHYQKMVFPERKFDYMITNPPFGVSWKSEEDFVKNESKK